MSDDKKLKHFLKLDSKLTIAVAKEIKQKDSNNIYDNYWIENDEYGNMVASHKCISNGVSRLYANGSNIKSLRGRWRNIITGKWEYQIDAFPTAVYTPSGIIEESMKIHKRKKFWVLCSGGKDSISSVNYLATKFKKEFQGVLHIDTTMGVEAGREWLKDYCVKMGWRLEIEKPPFDMFEWMIKTKGFGFPHLWLHSTIMRVAKLDPMREFVDRIEDGHDVGLISGVRAMESARRMDNYDTPLDRDDGKAAKDVDGSMVKCPSLWFIKPFFYKTTAEILSYLKKHDLQKSPVSDVLGYSGECNEGSFAKRGDLEKLGLVDTKLYSRIIAWEEWIDEHGSPMAKKCNRYGGSTRYGKEQHEQVMKDMNIDENMRKRLEAVARFACGSECNASTMMDMI